MTTYAYIRVSTDKQDVENQKMEIYELANGKGLGPVEWVEETVSGTRSWKARALGGILEKIQKGDVLIVAELSRLGRSMLEIMEILSIATQKEIRVYASKGGWELDGSIQARIMAMVLAMAAEIERDLISKRTVAALAARKAAGVKLGRPNKPGKSRLDPFRGEIVGDLARGVPKTRIAERLGTSVRNLSTYIKKRHLK